MQAASDGSEPAAVTYRAAEDTPEVILRDFEALLSTYARRCRVLELQLQARGIEPAPTPTGKQLLLAADVIEGKEQRLNMLQLRMLADLVRGFATWTE